ncbi:MAG: choice-of-anchor Q domain-containing protein [Chloroflexota bacterium]
MRKQLFLRGSVFLLLVALLLSAAPAQPAAAAIFNPTCTGGVGDVAELIATINTANSNGQNDTINLVAGCVYTLTNADNATAGGTGLPVITSNITVNGNGAILQRDSGTANNFRIFYVDTGGVLVLDSLTLRNGNVAGAGGAIHINGTGYVILRRNTLNNNNATDGGAVYHNSSTGLTIDNSTISGNTASNQGGGIYVAASRAVTLRYSTLSNNNAPAEGGGGVYKAGIFYTQYAIIANSTGGDCRGSGAFSPSVTLIEEGSAGTCTAATNVITGDPSLGPLADNGGVGQTHAILLPSPATEPGTSTQTVCGGFTPSQNGLVRPQGDKCDLGAFEYDYGPKVLTINRLDANPNKNQTVRFAVTFNESVTGVDNADFTLTTAGNISGASVTSVSGSGTLWTVTVDTGTLPGSDYEVGTASTIRLDLADNNTILDSASQPLIGPGLIADGSFTTGQVYDIDRVAPVVVSFVRADPVYTYTNQASVQYLVTFSEVVNGVDIYDFALSYNPPGSIGGASFSVSGSGTTRTLTVDTGYDSGATPGTFTGNLQIVLNDNNSIIDRAVNPLGGAASGDGNFTSAMYVIDKRPPNVVSITRLDPDPTGAAVVNFRVVFTEDVVGLDASDFALTLTGGVSGATVGTVTGSGATYQVAVNTGTNSGTLRLDLLDDDSVTDRAANPIGGFLGPGQSTYTGGEVYTIEKSGPIVGAPVVQSINRASTSPTNAASVNFTVIFNEIVTGVDVSDFAIAKTGAVSGESILNVGGSGTTYLVSVHTGTGSGTLGLNLADNNSIRDVYDNPLGGPANGDGNFTGQTYTLDKNPPSVANILLADPNPTAAASVRYTVLFTKPVTGVDAGDFALIPSGAITGASITAVAGSGITWTVTANTGANSGTLRLNLVDNDTIVDSLGTPLGGIGISIGNFVGPYYIVDRGGGTFVVSIIGVTTVDASPTTASTVDFTIIFNDYVTGVDVADFLVTTNGTLAGASVSSVSVCQTTYCNSYTITVNTGSGSGTLRLDVKDDDTIVNAEETPLGGVGPGIDNYTSGETYEIDRTPPIIYIFTATTPSSNRSIPITAFSASDNLAVTGYLITTSATPPAANDPAWAGVAPTTFVVAGDGTYTLYPWAKDIVGNVSNVFATPFTVVVDTTLPPTADLRLSKTADQSSVSTGETLTYALTVANLGQSTASQVVLTDTLPAGVELIGATFEGAACQAPQASLVVCSLAFIPAGGSAAASIQVVVPDRFNGSTVVNSATVSAAEDDPNPANNMASVSTPVVTNEYVVLDDDFEGALHPGWCSQNTGKTPSGQTFLGEFGNETLCLELTDLITHTRVTISFDVYVLRSWDGNRAASTEPMELPHYILGPDEWQFGLSGATPLLHTTFSNWPGSRQAYPGDFGTHEYPSMTGAAAVRSLGYFFEWIPMDSIYRLTYTFEHYESDLQIDFSAMGLDELDDESWGLDNVSVAISTDVEYKIYLPFVMR